MPRPREILPLVLSGTRAVGLPALT